MVIRTVHGRTHEIGRTGVHSDIFLVDMLFMDGGGHKAAVRPKHETAQFGIDSHIAHACRYQCFFKCPAHALTDFFNIGRLLVRAVGNADPAG
ncbi:hypothetical protein SDC9_198452 [bioreactor metagenome]|uniref:Uncharacterized protein n=1 Tax=bioreactor metagenome TaxID=1076179 RepID=A0A645IUJ1_9ZZZZ